MLKGGGKGAGRPRSGLAVSLVGKTLPRLHSALPNGQSKAHFISLLIALLSHSRRHVKCDESRPSCGQCIRLRRVCEGYQDLPTLENRERGSVDQTPIMRGSPSTIAPLRLLEPFFERSAWESKKLEEYWAIIFPKGLVASSQVAEYSTLGVFVISQEVYTQDDLVRFPLMANVLGAIGLREGKMQMLVEAWRMYGRALRLLALSINDSNQRRLGYRLVASVLLAKSEVCLLTNFVTLSSQFPTFIINFRNLHTALNYSCDSCSP